MRLKNPLSVFILILTILAAVLYGAEQGDTEELVPPVMDGE
jgi:hypothetical protein